MKKLKVLLHLIALIFLSLPAKAQKPVTWTEKELLEPTHLAAAIKENKKLPLIVSVGPGALIPNSIDIGPADDSTNLKNLKTVLAGKKKNTQVVVYCGCCPFAKCPNVRPALAVLKNAGFTNYHLLDLKTNLKTDWIDKGYPTVK